MQYILQTPGREKKEEKPLKPTSALTKSGYPEQDDQSKSIVSDLLLIFKQ